MTKSICYTYCFDGDIFPHPPRQIMSSIAMQAFRERFRTLIDPRSHLPILALVDYPRFVYVDSYF